MNPTERPAGFRAFLALLCAMVVVFAVAVNADTPPSGQGAVYKMGEMLVARWDDDATANCIALTNSSQQYTISDVRFSSYEICAYNNDAYVLAGSDPTATTSIGGHSRLVPAGSCTRLLRFDCVDTAGTSACDARKVAFRASSTVTGAQICIYRYDPAL